MEKWLSAYKTRNVYETAENRAKVTAYIKSYTKYPLVPKCMTLNDLFKSDI